MPNVTHVRLAALARRLIDSHGRNIELIRFRRYGSDADPVLQKDKTTVRAVQTKKHGKEDAALIEQTEIVFLLDADERPQANEKITDSKDGRTYSICDNGIFEICPGELSIIYKVYCGK